MFILGETDPCLSFTHQKYSTDPRIQQKRLIPENIPVTTRSLILASLSITSWRKHISALNNFETFEKYSKNPHPWPLSRESVQEYTSWALSHEKLKPSTVKSYLASMAFAHKMKDMDSSNCHNFKVKAMLRGAENLEFYTTPKGVDRRVMTYPLLKILGHQVAKSEWSENSKQVVWTTMLTAFFGSFRLGELLGSKEGSYNPSETLLWEDVVFKNDSVIIKIKIPKSRNPRGECVDLFELKQANYCPVTALRRLKQLTGSKARATSPVFTFESGKILTPCSLNTTLFGLLQPVIGQAACQITGHSFRAALPSALANRPDIACDEDIKLWGRWDSDAFRRYTRLKPNQKRAVFFKIVSSLESL